MSEEADVKKVKNGQQTKNKKKMKIIFQIEFLAFIFQENKTSRISPMRKT
jgi:hypothetical protein